MIIKDEDDTRATSAVKSGSNSVIGQAQF